MVFGVLHTQSLKKPRKSELKSTLSLQQKEGNGHPGTRVTGKLVENGWINKQKNEKCLLKEHA